MTKVKNIFQKYQGKLTINRTIHPTLLPLQFAIITAPGISKRQ